MRRRLEEKLMNARCLSCCSFLKYAKWWTSSTGNQYVCIWSWIELCPKNKPAKENSRDAMSFYPFPDRYRQGHTKLRVWFLLGKHIFFSLPCSYDVGMMCSANQKKLPTTLVGKRAAQERNFRAYHIPVEGSSSSFLEALAEVLTMCAL